MVTVLETFRLSGGKIRTYEERHEHCRQFRLGRKVGGDAIVESTGVCATGESYVIQNRTSDDQKKKLKQLRVGRKVDGDIEQQSDAIVESTATVESGSVSDTGGRMESMETIGGDRNDFETPNASGYRIGKKSTVTFDLDEDSSDDEECDPDLFAQIKSLQVESDLSQAIVQKQQDAEEYNKRAAGHAMGTAKELESMQGTHKKLLSIKTQTPSKRLRGMIDGEIRNLHQTCQTVIKAKRSVVDEPRRPRTEPRPSRPLDADADSDSDLHPINQAQDAPKGKRAFKSPHRLF